MLILKFRGATHEARIDLADLPKVQSFPGTWIPVARNDGRFHVQAKFRGRTISLARWILNAAADVRINYSGGPLDCRRRSLSVIPKRQRKPPSNESRLHSPAGWEHRLDDILSTLRSFQPDLLGRRDIERIFQVSRATAVRILDRFGPQLAAHALVVPRRQLITRLQALARNPALVWERERRQRIAEALASDRQTPHAAIEQSVKELACELQAGRTVVVEGGAETRRYTATRLEDLPAGVTLDAHRLTVEFTGFDELLMKFGAVLFALQNSATQIRKICNL